MIDSPSTQRKLQTAALRHPLRNGLAVARAGILSIRHASDLGIAVCERQRYFKKSIQLALCYSDFCCSFHPREPWHAGEAAFLSCAYDVVTDWRGFDSTYRSHFEHLLDQYASFKDLKHIALKLYEKDRSCTLSDDGLERGAFALRFITEMMHVREKMERRGINIDTMGKDLQIVDDIMDLERDQKNADTNCLLSPNRYDHLRSFLTSNVGYFFPDGSITKILIEAARQKGRQLCA